MVPALWWPWSARRIRTAGFLLNVHVMIYKHPPPRPRPPPFHLRLQLNPPQTTSAPTHGQYVDTLAFHPSTSQLIREPSRPVELVTKEAFVDIITPHAAPRGPIELVVLNSCKGEGLARVLQREARVRYVVYWKSEVSNDNCGMCTALLLPTLRFEYRLIPLPLSFPPPPPAPIQSSSPISSILSSTAA